MGVVRADLPVHCLHWQVRPARAPRGTRNTSLSSRAPLAARPQAVGEWELKMGPNTHDSSLTCGHEMPDRVMTMPDSNNGFDNPGFQPVRTQRVVLSDPDQVADEGGNKGFWTFIYDEGMEIRVAGKEVRARAPRAFPARSSL